MRRVPLFVLVLGIASCKGCGAADAPTRAEPDASPAPAVSIAPAPTALPNAGAAMTKLAELGPRIDACDAFEAGAGAPGTLYPRIDLRLELTIAPDGKVTATKVTSRNGGNDEIIACIRRVIEQAQLDPPAGGKQAVVNVPLHVPMSTARN